MSAPDDTGGIAGDAAVSEPSVTTSLVDGIVVGLVGTWQAFALVICGHLIRWRKWPPYVAKDVALVVISTVSGVLWTMATYISGGFVSREEGDILADCALENFLKWWTLCLHTAAFFIRVYRKWRILIKHDDKMWHTGHQVLLVSSVGLVPVAATWAVPSSGDFDESTNTCPNNKFVVVGVNMIGFLALFFLWFVCARQLKSVRKQFNEYGRLKCMLLCMTVTLASFVVFIFLADTVVLQRRIGIFYPLVTTYILLWGAIGEPLVKKMLRDDKYLWSFTKGFAELPSPAQLKASLAEQLSVKQLREEFHRYVTTRVAGELVDFYLDSLDREEMTGFFDRQAVTMRIVDRYIREGAPDQVNLSDKCRETILETDVTAYDIFDEARADVLVLMETNFQGDFVETEGFQRLVDASEEEQRELRVLRAGGILPPGVAVTPSAAAGAPTPGHRRLPGCPPFLVGLSSRLRKIPLFTNRSKGASEARRRRHNVGAGGIAHSGDAARVSPDSTRDSGSGSGRRNEGEVTIASAINAIDADLDLDLGLAPRPQREEGGRMSDARHTARSEVGGAECTGNVEMAGRDTTASHFKVYDSSCRYWGRRRKDQPAIWDLSEEAPGEEGIG